MSFDYSSGTTEGIFLQLLDGKMITHCYFSVATEKCFKQCPCVGLTLELM